VVDLLALAKWGYFDVLITSDDVEIDNGCDNEICLKMEKDV